MTYHYNQVKPGMIIEWEALMGRSGHSVAKCSGTVLKVTEKQIIVQGNRRQETISICALSMGEAWITKLEGGTDKMPRGKFEMPSIEILQKAKEESDNLTEMSEKLGVGKTTVHSWLQEAGISTKFSKPFIIPPDTNTPAEREESNNSQIEQIPVQQEIEQVKEVVEQLISQVNIVDTIVDLTIKKSADKVKAVIADELAMMLLKQMVAQGALSI